MKMHDNNNYLMSYQIDRDTATELASLVEQGTPGAKVHVSDSWIEQVSEFARTDETGEPYYQVLIVDEHFNWSSSPKGEAELFLANSLDMDMVSRGFTDAFIAGDYEFFGSGQRIDKTGAQVPLPSDTDLLDCANDLMRYDEKSVDEVEQELGL